MKEFLLVILLLVSSMSIGQLGSYDTQELKIDLGEIDKIVITLEMAVEPDGVYQYFQIPPVDIKKSVITLLLIDYQPYYITYWKKGDKYSTTFVIRSDGRDIIDDRDLTISDFKGEYRFEKGVLAFKD